MTFPVGNPPPSQVAGLVRAALLLWKAVRPRHWIKNLFVLAPLFFSGMGREAEKVSAALLAFAAFCAMASAIYVMNDIADRERDRLHPMKRARPIASGDLPVAIAAGAAVFLGLLSVLITILLPSGMLACMLIYLGVNAAYSIRLKHVVIVEVFCVGLGLVLRVVGGGVAIGLMPTSWLIVSTFLLALFMALAKRRNELALLKAGSADHRPVLEQYTPAFLDELISVVTPVTLVTYLLYTLDEETIARFGTKFLFPTGIFVVFGIFRYLYLVHQRDVGGDPVEVVLTDWPLAVTVLAWIASFVFIVYM